MTQFEKWALDPNGGKWKISPYKTVSAIDDWTDKEVWNCEKRAFTAGIQAERERLRALVEAEIEKLEDATPFGVVSADMIRMAIKSYEVVTDWLTAGTTPATPKKDRK